MVWDDRLISVKELTEIKRRTPRFPSRERNFAVRRRGPRRSVSLLAASLLSFDDDTNISSRFCSLDEQEENQLRGAEPFRATESEPRTIQ
ncbi:hypothetical protein TKK_0010873 [Trichogramma kaykai]